MHETGFRQSPHIAMMPLPHRCRLPNELFLVAGKEGSMLNALLADAAVVGNGGNDDQSKVRTCLRHCKESQSMIEPYGRWCNDELKKLGYRNTVTRIH